MNDEDVPDLRTSRFLWYLTMGPSTTLVDTLYEVVSNLSMGLFLIFYVEYWCYVEIAAESLIYLS